MALGVDSMSIDAEILGDEKIARMMQAAPKQVTRTLVSWLRAERTRYVGNKRKFGKFRNQIKRLRLGKDSKAPFKRESGTWQERLAKGFTGHVFGVSRIATLGMRAGIGLKRKTGFLDGLEKLDKGYTGSRTISSGKNMTIPAYSNLKKAGLAKRDFEYLVDSGRVFPVKKNGITLWFDDSQRAKGGANKGGLKKSALLFIGKRSVTLRPKFEFAKQWARDKANVIKRGKSRIARTIRAINKGYMEKI